MWYSGNISKSLGWVLMVVFLAMVSSGRAQESEDTAPKPGTTPPSELPSNQDRSAPDKPSIAERPVVVPPALRPDRAQVPERPPRPNGGDVIVPSGGLRALIQDFQTARETYMAQQRDLLRQIKDASAEERDAIRQQLKEKLDVWLQEQKEHIQTIRDQAKEMKNNLPAIRNVIDAAQEEGRPR